MISEQQQNQQSQVNDISPQNDSQKIDQNNQSIQKIIQISPNPNQQSNKNESIQSSYQEEQSRIQQVPQNPQKVQITKNVIMFPKNNTKHQKNQIKTTSQQSQQKQVLQIQLVYPWLNQKTRLIDNPLIKLHNQIIDYFLAFQEIQQTHNHLLFTFNKLQGLLFKTFRNCQVLAPFLANRVYLKNSQIQIFILFDPSNYKTPETIQKVKQCLQKTNLQQIRFFQVPPQQGRQHKIGFNCITQQKNYSIQIKLVTQQWISYLSMINDVLENNLQSKYLQLIFQTMLRQRGLQNSVKNYFVFGLISVFLHQRKRQKSRSLTENIIKFLEYFGIGPFTQRKISYVGRNEFDIIQDPQQTNNGIPHFSFWIGPTIDISNHMVKQFFSLLRNRYRLISSFNFAKSDSVLSALLNPIYDQFRY